MEAEECLNQVIDVPYNTEEIFGPMERELGKNLVRSKQIISKLENNILLNDNTDETTDISDQSDESNTIKHAEENIKLDIVNK